MGPITPVEIKTVWVSGFDLLQPVHVTKVRVHVKKNVVVAVLHETAIFGEVSFPTITSC